MKEKAFKMKEWEDVRLALTSEKTEKTEEQDEILRETKNRGDTIEKDISDNEHDSEGTCHSEENYYENKKKYEKSE